MAREEINDQNLEQIVGGAVQFYTNSQGKPRVNITGMGSFDCVADGFFRYVEMRNADPGKTEAEYVQMAFDRGMFFKP